VIGVDSFQGRVLITGGAGFLGSALVNHFLKKGVEITVVDSARRLSNYAYFDIRLVKLVELEWPDYSGLKDLGKFDSIIHLAWTTNPASSMRDVSFDASSNILGTIELLETMKCGNSSKIIFLSSGGTVYGNNSGGVVSEESATNPVSAYGISKLACEKYVNLYGSGESCCSTVLRLGNPYGPYQLNGTPVGVISSFIRHLHANRSIDIYGTGENVRDFIHIDDVVSAISMCVCRNDVSGVFNLGSGKGYSINQILQIIEELTEQAVEVNYLPDRRADVREIILDVNKIKRHLGFECKTSLVTGISEMLTAGGLKSKGSAAASVAE
jgi:UDP-glucose 4-epimerase